MTTPTPAPRYITNADLQLLLGTSASESSLLDSLIISAEALFDNLVGSDTGLLTSDKTEDHAINNLSQSWENRGRVFYLKTVNPTAVKTINAVSPGTLDVDYTLTFRTLEFKYPVVAPQTFPYRYRIVYTSGYADINAIPQDIKMAIKYISIGLYNRKNSEGIQSFKQDLLSVSYDKNNDILNTILDPAQKSFVVAVINRYQVPVIFSTNSSVCW